MVADGMEPGFLIGNPFEHDTVLPIDREREETDIFSF